MSDTQTVLTEAGLPNVAALYALSLDCRIAEIGSSSVIHPDFNAACQHVRQSMWSLGGIKSSGEITHPVWRLIGTDDEMFYLSGYKLVEQKVKFVPVPEYLQILESILGHINNNHLKQVDDLCGAFCTYIRAIRQEDVRYRPMH